jgi:hypothetical protein
VASRSTTWFPLAALLLAACDEPSAAEKPSDWPPGTVVAVDHVPISVDEVDEASVWIELIDPKSSGPQLRRLALTNVSLPRALSQAMAPEAWLAARSDAQAAFERLRAGRWTGPPKPDGAVGEIVEGSWQELSIVAWGHALSAPVGEWSEPVDDVGRFLLLKLIERQDLPHSAALRVKVDVLEFPYLPDDADVEAAKDDHHLTIVDLAWREIVPERTQYRMGAR